MFVLSVEKRKNIFRKRFATMVFFYLLVLEKKIKLLMSQVFKSSLALERFNDFYQYGIANYIKEVEKLLPELAQQIHSDELIFQSTSWPPSACSLLHIIAEYSKINIEILFEKGAKVSNINVQDAKGNTPLHVACLVGNVGAITVLLEQGADINLKDHCGETPIFPFLRTGHYHKDILRLFIKFGVDLRTKDKFEKNILHMICIKGDIESAKLLINQGCPYDEKTIHGVLPIDYLDSQAQKEFSEYTQLMRIR